MCGLYVICRLCLNDKSVAGEWDIREYEDGE